MSSNSSSQTGSTTSLVDPVSSILDAIPEESRSYSPQPRFGIGYQPATPDRSGPRESSWNSDPLEVALNDPIASMLGSLTDKRAFRRRTSRPSYDFGPSLDAPNGPPSSPVTIIGTHDSPTILRARMMVTNEVVRLTKQKNQFDVESTRRRKRGSPNPKKQAQVLSLLPLVRRSPSVEPAAREPSSSEAGPSTSSAATLRSIPSLERDLKELCELQKAVLLQLRTARIKEFGEVTALVEKETSRILVSEVALNKEFELLEALDFVE
jgi:hypothetical protein